jgi:catechol 2,3-dioxygenase-like lactoylglutathione lyase family enzyme
VQQRRAALARSFQILDDADKSERNSSMSSSYPIREVRIALTVESFDQAVQFYRDGLGLVVVEQWQTAEGRGIILALGPHTTLELFDTDQAALVDRLEVGRRVSGPVRLAFQVRDVEAEVQVLQQAGAKLLSHPTVMPWGDRNARLETPDGMQVTLYQIEIPEEQQNEERS